MLLTKFYIILHLRLLYTQPLPVS